MLTVLAVSVGLCWLLFLTAQMLPSVLTYVSCVPTWWPVTRWLSLSGHVGRYWRLKFGTSSVWALTSTLVCVQRRWSTTFYYYYAAFSAPCVGCKDDESQAQNYYAVNWFLPAVTHCVVVWGVLLASCVCVQRRWSVSVRCTSGRCLCCVVSWCLPARHRCRTRLKPRSTRSQLRPPLYLLAFTCHDTSSGLMTGRCVIVIYALPCTTLPYQQAAARQLSPATIPAVGSWQVGVSSLYMPCHAQPFP